MLWYKFKLILFDYSVCAADNCIVDAKLRIILWQGSTEITHRIYSSRMELLYKPHGWKWKNQFRKISKGGIKVHYKSPLAWTGQKLLKKMP